MTTTDTRTSADIRRQFLSYFEQHGHRIVPSHSLIPPSDPTLLFVNAGMVQFKDVFTGERDPGYRRAATTQKCLRVSGKHNDLEQVGRTPRHHTFFEMLGNFSFGDYFKRDAIRFAWELLTQGYGLPVDRLWVTVHPDDAEAREVWLSEVGVEPRRVLEDPGNFWAMGETGPCGPCSEIHMDRGDTFVGSDLLKDPGDRFMELWNLVFMQFNRDEHGAMTPLPAPSIDTGMGLERICAVLQGARTNYDTDLFRPLIEKTAAVARVEPGRDPEADVALRVVADHARATAFLISDGVYPENEGRGYVLRRLMRRAIRFGHKLGLRGPFFTPICLSVEEVLGDAWPELRASAAVIERVAGQEEERFLRTLSSGMELLEGAIDRAKQAGEPRLDGRTVFVLYDTHGFPVDLTQVVAEEHGLGIDEAGFEREMQVQRDRGRASWKGADDSLAPVLRACEQAGYAVRFAGYETTESDGTVLALFENGDPVQQALGAEVLVVCDETPFYGESGGQVGDTGTIEWGSGRAEVLDTLRPRENLILHRVRVRQGPIRAGERVRLRVDRARRDEIRRHHSATHLLHHALRAVLGPHVRQRGSLVAPDRLRFDFSHPAALTPAEIEAIEDHVAQAVLRDEPVQTDILSQQDAIARGALHFFGDKYGETVRMVTIGKSRELCGGTHVARTGQIGPLRILGEVGISAGVRRIEAVAGLRVLQLLRRKDRLIDQLRSAMRCDEEALPERIGRLQTQVRDLEREVSDLKVRISSGHGGPTGEVHRVAGIEVLVHDAEGVDGKALRELADVLRGRVRSGYALLTRTDGDGLQVVLAATKDAARPAGEVLRSLLGRFGGRGGGGPMLAQGGVKGVDRQQVLDALLEILRSSG